MYRIGVLSIQGDISEHLTSVKAALDKRKLEGQVIRVNTQEEIRKVNALIIPGGESTTISRFIEKENLDNEIRKLAQRGGAIMGTCAGVILLAKECNDKNIKLLKLMDISINRNAYGRQRESFATDLEIEEIGNFPGVFIRAPEVIGVGKKAKVMATHAGKPVMVREGNLLALTFHPELTKNLGIHEYFLGLI